MKKIKLALALAGAVGLVAACGGGSGEEAGTPPEETGSNAVMAPIENAEAAVADVEKAAEGGMSTEMQTLSFTVEGMS
jgi:hypothetical protein